MMLTAAESVPIAGFRCLAQASENRLQAAPGDEAGHGCGTEIIRQPFTEVPQVISCPTSVVPPVNHGAAEYS